MAGEPYPAMPGQNATGTSYPLATVINGDIVFVTRAVSVANPSHPSMEVEDAPRDAQPARLSGEVL